MLSERYLAELGKSKSPSDLLKLLKSRNSLRVKDLEMKDTCTTLELGDLLGSGKNGDVFSLDDQENRGILVVLKEIKIKDGWNIEDDFIVLESAMSEIIMSAYFHSIYESSINYSVNFPYYEGFFSCGSKAYIIVEELDTTIYDYIMSDEFNSATFTGLMFQFLFALECLRDLQIMHNDCHAKNLMLRSTDNSRYKNQDLSSEEEFTYIWDDISYGIPNRGMILKLMDFDWAAKYSEPKICPRKLHGRSMDKWNLQSVYTPSYDLLTAIGHLINILWIKHPKGKEYESARLTLALICQEIVEDVIILKGSDYITRTKNFEKGMRENRGDWSQAETPFIEFVAKTYDMVNRKTKRPLEKYSKLDLGPFQWVLEGLDGIHVQENAGKLVLGEIFEE